MLDDDHRGASGDEAEHGGGHALAEHRVDAPHGLVEDDQLRLGHADAGELEQALLAAAEVARALVAELEQAELVEDGAGAVALLVRRPALSALLGPRRDRQKRSRRGSKWARMRFSRTVSAGHSRGVWKVRIRPRREMRCGGLPCTMRVPSNSTVPASGSLNPEMRSMAVLLPAPLGPISPVTWPSAAVNEQWLTACTPAEVLAEAGHLEQRGHVAPEPNAGAVTGSFSTAATAPALAAGVAVAHAPLREDALGTEADEQHQDDAGEDQPERGREAGVAGRPRAGSGWPPAAPCT